MVGLIGSLETSRIGPERMQKHVLKRIEKFSLQNQRALAYALGGTPLFHRTLDNNFFDKIMRPPAFKGRRQQELLSVYYRGVGAFIVNFYEPNSGQWPPILLQGLGRVEEKWQEAILWGAGFEAPFYFEDPYEYERMAEAIPPELRSAFRQGLSDRFAWGGRNRWIEKGAP